MKVAFVHDYIKEYGGAERVLETLHQIYPDAPVFTLVYCPQFLGPHKERFQNLEIKTSFLQYIPFKEKMISIFRLFAPFIFPLFNFSGYDVIIISATGAYSPNMINKKSAKQICYCHTPPRYLYGYATAREWKNNPTVRVFAEIANHFLRMVDFVSAQKVDMYIANSENVKARIEKFYRKDALVIYPPIDVINIKMIAKKENYFLAGGRLARPKHIDLVMRACNELQINLKIFGKGFAGYGDALKNIAGSTIEFVGEVRDEEKIELMQKAKAYIFASEDEDFGITPVEAMAAGTPVIAYKSGGVVESVVDGKTGLFFEELTLNSLVSMIKKFESLRQAQGKRLSDSCRLQAEKFSKDNFIKGIKKIVTASMK